MLTVQIQVDFAAAASDDPTAARPSDIDKALTRIRRRVRSAAPAMDWTVSKLIGVQGSVPDTGQNIARLGWELRDAVTDGLGPRLARLAPIRVQVRRAGTTFPAIAGGRAPETYTIG